MMKSMHLLLVALMVTLLVSCDGEQVALNERVLSESTGALLSSGCYLFELGGGDQTSSTGGSVSGSSLTTNVSLDGSTVVVLVKDGRQVLVQRQYGTTFFDSGKVDQFTVTPTSGGDAALMRYWGKANPGGTAGCAPATELVPPTADASTD
jgi:hypothetical protein